MSVFVIFTVLLIASVEISARPSEDERIDLWHKNNVWPPKWQPESDGYRTTMENREREIQQLTGADERWENWMQYTQARMLPKFTPLGFEVIKTPLAIHAKLANAVKKGIDNWDNLRFEDGVADSIYGPSTPKFVDLGSLAQEVLGELKDYHENWVGGMKLRPTSAYGVRLYQNQSTIVMHNDKPHTHVISSIVHIAHEYDNDEEPWPIQIEDHNGKLHSVSLAPGEMLFYESAVCLHGRKKLLKGKYYGSIFLHYQPVDKTIWNYTIEDVIANVAPHWRDGITEEHGSRWAGQAITVDSMVVDNAPPRVFNLPRSVASQYSQEQGEESETDDDSDFYASLAEEQEEGQHEEL